MIEIINKIRDSIINEFGYDVITTAKNPMAFNQDLSNVVDDAKIYIPVNVDLATASHDDIGNAYTRAFSLPIMILVGRPILGSTDEERTNSILERMKELDDIYNNLSRFIRENETQFDCLFILQNNDEIYHNLEIEYQSGALMNFQTECKI